MAFVIAVEVIYMAISRIIAREVDSYAHMEILRTPFRIASALFFWIAMRDVLAKPVRRPETLRNRPFLVGLAFLMAAPALAYDHQLPPADEFVLAVTSVPVGFAEELFARGIVQTLCVARWGAWRGVAISTIVFAAYHLGVTRGDDVMTLMGIALTGFMLGLIYLKSGSLLSVIVIQAVYDALFSLPRFVGSVPAISGMILEAIAALYFLIWATSKKETLARF